MKGERLGKQVSPDDGTTRSESPSTRSGTTSSETPSNERVWRRSAFSFLSTFGKSNGDFGKSASFLKQIAENVSISKNPRKAEFGVSVPWKDQAFFFRFFGRFSGTSSKTGSECC